MKPFNREKYLLYLLGGIFAFQASLFAVGFSLCFNFGGLKACPELGTRYENTFNVMIATTLALLSAGAVAGVTQRKPLVSDLASPLPLSPQPQGQGKVQESVRASVRARNSGKES